MARVKNDIKHVHKEIFGAVKIAQLAAVAMVEAIMEVRKMDLVDCDINKNA